MHTDDDCLDIYQKSKLTIFTITLEDLKKKDQLAEAQARINVSRSTPETEESKPEIH
jgi:hypothetical protein